jgi:hypothetical protein
VHTHESTQDLSRFFAVGGANPATRRVVTQFFQDNYDTVRPARSAAPRDRALTRSLRRSS